MSRSGPFRVSFPGVTTDRLRSLLRRAAATGHSQRVRAALAEIEQRLIADPVGWGDPLCHYTDAKAMAYRRLYDELLIEYAVHDDLAEVWLIDVVPVLGHPLRAD